MCLILFAWQAHPDYQLVVASNRDEVYARPTEPLAWRGEVLSGLDVAAGGTWLGVGANGRFAALTNAWDPADRSRTWQHSRGELVSGYLTTTASPQEYAETAAAGGATYAGFNLLVAEHDELWWATNRPQQRVERVPAGIHGLSNAALDTPWHKVVGGVADFTTALQADTLDRYFDVLADRRSAPWREVRRIGGNPLFGKRLSARFVRTRMYGTRVSTVLRIRADGSFDMTERRFDRRHRIGETTVDGSLGYPRVP